MRNASSPISAEAVLKSKTGRSFLKEGISPSAANVDDFAPSADTTEAASRGLQDLGFVIGSAGITLSFSGEREMFERAFSIKLQAEAPRPGTSLKYIGEIQIPQSLTPYIEEILFPEQPEFFV